MASTPPDYYKVLEISSTATQTQIREAYKKAALKHHPDRVPAESPERAARTRKFQQVNDAYYTLSDPTRRHEYDDARKFSGGFGFGAGGPASSHADPDEEDIPRPQPGTSGPGFNWSSFFGGQTEQERTERADEQFRSAYEEMLREEGMADGEQQPTSKFWSYIGGLSGGALGFIVANVPGAVAGAVAGNRLGAVRDAKGKSVYEVFQTLPQSEKAQLLSDLAAKIFAHAVSG